MSGPIANCMETNLYTVEGKIAGPLQVTPSKVAFGSQQLGTTSPTQAVTVKNISSSNVTVSSAALDAATGTPGDFKIAGGTCVGASLPVTPAARSTSPSPRRRPRPSAPTPLRCSCRPARRPTPSASS